MKSFNFTGRKRILREDVFLSTESTDKPFPSISVRVLLSDYEFPSAACVFLEASWKKRFMRIDLGAAKSEIRVNNINLKEFDHIELINFRLKVINPYNSRIMGMADNLKPFTRCKDDDRNYKSILPIVSANLGDDGVIWKLDFDEQKVVLQIEERLGTKEQIASSLTFKSIILPAAFQQILTRVTQNECAQEMLDPEDFCAQWILFVEQLGVKAPAEDLDDYDEWISDAIAALSKRIAARDELLASLEKGGQLI